MRELMLTHHPSVYTTASGICRLGALKTEGSFLMAAVVNIRLALLQKHRIA